MNSRHWETDRTEREAIIRAIGVGNVIKTVVVDRGHRNGPEVHKITDTGIVVIYNQYTGRMITKLVARPNQIRRYYRPEEVIPANLLRLAREHQMAGYNV